MAIAMLPPPIHAANGDFTWLDWYTKLFRFLTATGAIRWEQLDFTGSKLSDLETRPHNDLQTIQGGATSERYHVTQAEHGAVQALPYTYTAGDTLYASSTTTLSKFAKPSANAFYTMGTSGVPAWKLPRYGAFDNTTNTAPAANTPTAITYNAATISSGVSVGTPTSRIVIDTAGLYNIQFSAQFANTSASLDDVVFWLRVNGTDVTNTASWLSLPAKHAGVNGHAILALNLFYQFSANDYFELYWMTVNGTTALSTIPAGTSPAYPESPAVILTVSDNISA